jgi:hypothetical protein
VIEIAAVGLQIAGSKDGAEDALYVLYVLANANPGAGFRLYEG